MQKEINVLELADALAEKALARQWEAIDDRGENVFVEEENGDLRYCAEAQEIYNYWYGYYFEIIDEL
jgi:hypothetical protein